MGVHSVGEGAIPFNEAFCALTGFQPMKWQERLYGCFLENRIPGACDIPTGLGKTSVIALWLIALADQANHQKVFLPRRLVYVVNRRTIVDQATDEVAAIRKLLNAENKSTALADLCAGLNRLCVNPEDNTSHIAISTLRGEFADNGDWFADPARASIAVGTVDMIGSRLLFSGYNLGKSRRALHAGLIGQDTLIVHDEAHLTPAFGHLLRYVRNIQQVDNSPRPIRVLELSATPRAQGVAEGVAENLFALTESESSESVVRRRIHARKALSIRSVDRADLVDELAEKALEYRGARKRILIYVRTPEVAKAVTERLVKHIGIGAQTRVGVLTGTMRGFERAKLLESKLFESFFAKSLREELPETRYIVSTSAGEVGINLDADHLVSDLTTLESMVQRLGRVNRLGRDDREFVSQVNVLHAKQGKETDYEVRCGAARLALERLPRLDDGHVDASPAAIRTILDAHTIEAAYAPQPRIVPCTDTLLDNWALTSISRPLPGRPPVDVWLHGVSPNEEPETTVLWRAETKWLASAELSLADVRRYLLAHRIMPHEKLRCRSRVVFEELRKISKRFEDAKQDLAAITIAPDNEFRVWPLGRLVEKGNEDVLFNATVVLPVEAGGLSESGFLSGSEFVPGRDVADERLDRRGGDTAAPTYKRLRIAAKKEDGRWTADIVSTSDTSKPFSDLYDLQRALDEFGERKHLSAIEQVVIRSDEDDEPELVLISLESSRSIDAALDSSSAASQEQTLIEHSNWAKTAARVIVQRLALNSGLQDAIPIAAFRHDTGKDRRPWQRAIGNRRLDIPLAKSGRRGFKTELCPGYRHEFGSLLDAQLDQELVQNLECDLILHSIASHHGWARPHFEEKQWDPKQTEKTNAEAAAETFRRFVRLQRRYGRWGLAWLEAVLKSADVIATVHGRGVEDLVPEFGRTK